MKITAKENNTNNILQTNCWVRPRIFAFFPSSFTSTTSQRSLNVFILNSNDILSHEICWFWSRNSCLYGRYVSTFFRERKRHTCATLENKSNALNALHKDSNIVISKPDKGNGVVVLNSTDYVAKMQTILCDTNISSPAITITMSLTFLNFRFAWGISRLKRQLMKTRTGRSIQLLPTHQQCMVFLKYMHLICFYNQFCHL